jgi:hypothetical protein
LACYPHRQHLASTEYGVVTSTNSPHNERRIREWKFFQSSQRVLSCTPGCRCRLRGLAYAAAICTDEGKR